MLQSAFLVQERLGSPQCCLSDRWDVWSRSVKPYFTIPPLNQRANCKNKAWIFLSVLNYIDSLTSHYQQISRTSTGTHLVADKLFLQWLKCFPSFKPVSSTTEETSSPISCTPPSLPSPSFKTLFAKVPYALLLSHSCFLSSHPSADFIFLCNLWHVGYYTRATKTSFSFFFKFPVIWAKPCFGVGFWSL